MDIIKNDIIEGKIENQGNSGEGVLRIDNFPVFVEYALPDEVIRAKVLKVNKTHAFGKITEIIEESPCRVEAICPYFYRCGGCTLMHENYEAQLKFKTQRVKDCFIRIGNFKEEEILIKDCIGMENPYEYRNKVQLPLSRNESNINIGFYSKRSHNVIDIDKCLIQNEESNYILNLIRNWVKEENIKVYNEEKVEKLAIRHLLIRKAFFTDEIMVVPVFTSVNEKIKESLRKLFITSKVKITSLQVNINNKKTNTILGDENILLMGKDFIVDTIGDKKYKISAHSFFQVNPIQTKVMYDKVLEFGDFKKDETVYDLYCGAGTIGIYVSNYVKEVIGVEIVPQAIVDANENKKLNNIDNITFIEGKSEIIIKDLLEKKTHPNTIILDPPRKGCDIELLKSICTVMPNKIVYVSCDPATLARDARYLKDNGYQLKIVQPVDNFPQTSHIETIVLMSKVAPNK